MSNCLWRLRHKTGNIDLAFIDVHMPELSGTEAFWVAKRQGVRTFVTLMSSSPSTQAVEMARQLRAYEFLFKPFTASDVLAILKSYSRIAAVAKVLVVDDSSTVRQVVQRVLRSSIFQCEVTEAANGASDLALSRTTEFDVVFLDCNLPILSGIDAMKQLLMFNPALKVVMISAQRDLSLEHEAMDAGACAFLYKPFYSVDVDRTLHTAFGLRSPTLKLGQPRARFRRID